MKIAGVDIHLEGSSGLSTPVDARPLLFRPLTIRGVTIKNRIMVPPMSQYLAEGGTSMANDWHLVHLGQFAMGGAGLVFCEETSVEARGRRTHNCAGIYTQKQVRAWRRVTDFMKDLGAVPAIQLGHAGRRGSIRSPWEGRAPLTQADAARGRAPWTTVSSSAMEDRPGKPIPMELDRAGIRGLIKTYADAARRSIDAGFEAIEIHGAHGYLIFQFLSPLFNHRTDAYGGSLEARMRFPLEVAEAVRAALPADTPLFFRASAVDAAGGHWDIDDTVALSLELKQRGVDVIDCSSGSGSGPTAQGIPVPKGPGYHVRYADHLKRETGMISVASGNIVKAEQAEEILQSGKADLIAVGRAMLCDPYWAAHAGEALGLPDWLWLLAPTYAARLIEREKEWQRWPANHPHPVPFRR